MPQDTVAFVRTESLPELPPPASEQGLVRWLRDNLFSSWGNGALTVLGIIAIYSILAGALPWILNGVWDTSSLAECREVLQGKTGACFSVWTERWHQFLYGITYPQDAYWRPNLAFLLLLVAIAPVLFFDLPRQLLIVTALFPFAAYWLIWGGSIWVPIFIIGGLAAAFWGFARYNLQSFAVALFAFVGIAILLFLNPLSWILGLLSLLLSVFTSDPVSIDLTLIAGATVEGEDAEAVLSLRSIFPLIQWPIKLFDWVAPIGLEPVQSRDLGGYMLNMMLGVTCVSLSIPLGIVLALGRQSSMPFIKFLCVIFIEFIRGVPLITLLFVASVMLAFLFPPGSTPDLFLRVVIMITLFSSAYIAEVIRGGLAALPKGQYEAADSLGLDYPQAMRLIILPQALKISIPGIVNVAVGLFKDTTLVLVISMFDILGFIRGPLSAATEWNGVYWEPLLFACIVFFIVCYGISQYSQWLERRLATDHR